MSTPDQPETPQLTRRQLREQRDTASNPIITPGEAAAAAAGATGPVIAPLPRAAEPLAATEEPPADAEVDLDSPALTRRAARQQERLRTASVPVVDGAADESDAPDADQESEDAHRAGELVEDAAPDNESEPAPAVASEDDDAPGVEDASDDAIAAEIVDHADDTRDADGEVADDAGASEDSPDEPYAATHLEPLADEDLDAADDEDAAEAFAPKPVVAPTFGSGLLAGEGVELELPASFDQLLSRGSNATGSLAASNALILSQTPETGSFASPVTATGEVLLTGTFSLPESFGSTGTSHGSSDGKEIDAILVDAELPSASSPTPIAASSAISTIKSAEDIIKPPVPEKGSRLMLALVITAGALALALTGVLIVALVTGAFQ